MEGSSPGRGCPGSRPGPAVVYASPAPGMEREEPSQSNERQPRFVGEVVGRGPRAGGFRGKLSPARVVKEWKSRAGNGRDGARLLAVPEHLLHVPERVRQPALHRARREERRDPRPHALPGPSPAPRMEGGSGGVSQSAPGVPRREWDGESGAHLRGRSPAAPRERLRLRLRSATVGS